MNKIDIRDLRVGDWVMIHPWDETPWEPQKITDINFHSWEGTDFCDSVGGDVWDELSLDDIKPIHLTKEILEKNGFKEGRFGFYSYRLVDGSDKVYLNSTFTELEYENVCHNYDDPDEVNYSSSMEFPKPLELHQLQNILRDLGLEKQLTI